MNILQICTFDKKGGAARVAYTIKNELEKISVATSLFVKRKYSSDKNVFEIKPFRFQEILSKIFATDIDFWSSDRILKTNEYKQCNIVHIHNINGNFFKLKTLKKIAREKPIIWTLHDMWPITGHNAWGYDLKEAGTNSNIIPIEMTPKLMWNNRRYLFNKKMFIYNQINMHIVCPSFWIENEVKKSILKNQNILTLHNGINIEVFKMKERAFLYKKLNIPNNKTIISFVSVGGKDNIQKGWQFTEEVTNFYKDREDILFLCIGGKAPALPQKNILYINYISDEEILSDYYNISDIFLFTSIAENFPLVILEAMACGTLIATFDVGGVKEAVLHKQNGYVAQYKSTTDLIRGLEYLTSLSKEQLDCMRRENVERVSSNFSSTVMIQKYLQLYKTITNEI